MSAEPRTLKTEAEETLVRNYRVLRNILPGTPRALAFRDAAIASFEMTGLPHRRVEAWKYTDLRALMKRAEGVAAAALASSVAAKLAAHPTFGTLDRYRLVLADGHFVEELSDREALIAEGIEVATLAEALAIDSAEAASVLGAIEPAAADPLVTLNAAYASDGVVIRARPGAAPRKALEIVHLTTADSPAAWFARSFADIGSGAKLTLLVSHVGKDGVAYQANSFVGVKAGSEASISVVDLQAEGNAAQHVATFTATMGANAALRHLAVTGGAALSRLQAFASLEGEGANLLAAGANMLSGKQHGDVAWRIDHEAPGATSRVLYKNVAADEAFGAFQGLILVRPGAQKTDGQMLTRTLLVSGEAQFAAKPELEIYADDVKCGHGATVGEVDEAALFYLMARGIPRAEAKALLVEAFLAEAVEAIGDPTLGKVLAEIVASWLARRAA